jgi:hypothetical protein
MTQYNPSGKDFMKSSLLALAFLLFGTLPANANQLPADSRIATVVSMSGNVWKINSPTDKLLVRVGDHLKPKSVLETDATGNAILKLGTDVAVQVKPNSHFTIDLKQDVDWQIKLESGALLSAVKNPEKRKDHFKISTRTATMGVRGTAFYVKEEAGKPTYLCTCHGTIEVKTPSGKLLKTIQTTHHNEPVMIGPKVTQVVMDTEHTDADIKALENIL